MQVPLSSPDISQREIDYVLDVLKTPYLTLGPKIEALEKSFIKYLNVSHALATCNGTAGLHLAIRALGIGNGDEVITSPFSFVASANVIPYEKAIPVFVDVDPKTYNIDPVKIKNLIDSKYSFDGKKLINKDTKGRLAGILPVHIFGHPVDMEPVLNIAKKFKLVVVEDACEALGSYYQTKSEGEEIWKPVGTLGSCGVFSFYPNKQITTGEGGIVVTDDLHIAKLIISMRNHGRSDMVSIGMAHERLGYNYRLDEMSAAMGLAQMERFNEMSQKRKRVAENYHLKLQDIEEIELPYEANYARVNWWVYVIRVKKQSIRDSLMQFLRNSGIGVRPYFPPIHLLPHYQKTYGYKEGDFPITEDLAKRTIGIPYHNNLTEEEMNYVVEKIKEGLSKIL